jgi:capsular exopolysaccharide synthesis family protein
MRSSLSLLKKKRDHFQVLLVTSALPNEGKTFSASCLALVLAQEPGKRVLLIDADFRTASAANLLGLDGKQGRPGLHEVLSGEAHIETAVTRCAELNLYFLPAGGSVGGPTELLAAPGLEGLVRRCREIFDWIIIDSPPVLALADANIVVPVCDSTILVVRAEKTPEKLIKSAINRVGSDRICGVLVNGVRTVPPSRYYSHYYQDAR